MVLFEGTLFLSVKTWKSRSAVTRVAGGRGGVGRACTKVDRYYVHLCRGVREASTVHAVYSTHGPPGVTGAPNGPLLADTTWPQ